MQFYNGMTTGDAAPFTAFSWKRIFEILIFFLNFRIQFFVISVFRIMTLPSCSNEGTTIVDEERDQQNHSFQCNNDSNNWIDVLGSDKQNKLSRYDRILTITIEDLKN